MAIVRAITSHQNAAARGGTLEAARAALRQGEWAAARERFEALVSPDPSLAEAWEGLADACYWLQDTERALEARQAAYLAYRERNDAASAARAACWLAAEHLEARGEPAVAAGWLERARQLLEGLAPTVEHALLRALDAHLAMGVDHDLVAAREAAREAGEIARELGDLDQEMQARAIEGLSRVVSGDVRGGMRLLDAAAAAAFGGEMADLNAITITCCYVVQACERVRDLDRAMEWCGRFREICVRRHLGSFLTFCRLQHGTVLLWRGAWAEAEAELLAALAEFEALKPPGRNAALVRLGELRRRQGRWEEAESLLEEARTHHLAPLWSGALALDRGNPLTAREAALRALRRGPPDDRAHRALALELLVRACAAGGAADDAERLVPELEALAAELATEPIRGAARFAAGVTARAQGDVDQARRALEDAADLFEVAGCPFETAHARLALADLLDRDTRSMEAREHALAAAATFERLGSSRWQREAMRRAGDLEAAASAPAAPAPRHRLTPRQREILRLVAQGDSNREIAKRLFLSEHTVRRHLANVFTRLDVSSRAAAVARAMREDLL